jgi:hypothetical protein
VDTFWDWFWLSVWWFFFVMYLILLFQICADLFRDRQLSGWWKAVWVLALVVAPFLAALVYIIARGRGMAERQAAAAVQARQQTEEYIREAAGRSPAAEIAQAKALLDAGAIDATEYAVLKERALA